MNFLRRRRKKSKIRSGIGDPLGDRGFSYVVEQDDKVVRFERRPPSSRVQSSKSCLLPVILAVLVICVAGIGGTYFIARHFLWAKQGEVDLLCSDSRSDADSVVQDSTALLAAAAELVSQMGQRLTHNESSVSQDSVTVPKRSTVSESEDTAETKMPLIPQRATAESESFASAEGIPQQEMNQEEVSRSAVRASMSPQSQGEPEDAGQDDLVVVTGFLDTCSIKVLEEFVDRDGFRVQYIGGVLRSNDTGVSVYHPIQKLLIDERVDDPWQSALYLPARYAPRKETNGRFERLLRKIFDRFGSRYQGRATTTAWTLIDSLPDDVLILCGFPEPTGFAFSPRSLVFDVKHDYESPVFFIPTPPGRKVDTSYLERINSINRVLPEDLHTEYVKALIVVPRKDQRFWKISLRKAEEFTLGEAATLDVRFGDGDRKSVYLKSIQTDAGPDVVGFGVDRPSISGLDDLKVNIDENMLDECHIEYLISRLPERIDEEQVAEFGLLPEESVKQPPETGPIEVYCYTEHLKLPAARMSISVNDKPARLDNYGMGKFPPNSSLWFRSSMYKHEGPPLSVKPVTEVRREPHGLLDELYQAVRLGEWGRIREKAWAQERLGPEEKCALELLKAEEQLLNGRFPDLSTLSDCGEATAELHMRVENGRLLEHQGLTSASNLSEIAMILEMHDGRRGLAKDRELYSNAKVPTLRTVGMPHARKFRKIKQRQGVLLSFADSLRPSGHLVRFLVEPLLYKGMKPDHKPLKGQSVGFPDIWLWFTEGSYPHFSSLLEGLKVADVGALALVADDLVLPEAKAMLKDRGITFESYQPVKRIKSGADFPTRRPWLYVTAGSWEKYKSFLDPKALKKRGVDIEVRILRYLFVEPRCDWK